MTTELEEKLAGFLAQLEKEEISLEETKEWYKKAKESFFATNDEERTTQKVLDLSCEILVKTIEISSGFIKKWQSKEILLSDEELSLLEEGGGELLQMAEYIKKKNQPSDFAENFHKEKQKEIQWLKFLIVQERDQRKQQIELSKSREKIKQLEKQLELKGKILPGQAGKNGDIDQSVGKIAELELLRERIKELEQDLKKKLTNSDYEQLIKEINEEVEKWKKSWEKDNLVDEGNIRGKIRSFLQLRKGGIRSLVEKILELKWELISKQKELDLLKEKLGEKREEFKSKIKGVEKEWREKQQILLRLSRNPLKDLQSLIRLSQLQEAAVRNNNDEDYEKEIKDNFLELEEEKPEKVRNELEEFCQIQKKLTQLKIQLENVNKTVKIVNYSGTFNASVFGGDITTGDGANFDKIDTQNNYSSEAQTQQNNPPKI